MEVSGGGKSSSIVLTIRRRPTPMELAELVAGATVRRRLRGKQSTPRRLTGKQPPQSDSLPQSSSPATETAPEEEEPSVMPEEAEPWRPLTETEKKAWNAFPLKKEKCATPWSTDCIENLGIQTSDAWWTVFAKIMLIPQCWRPPNSCGAQLVKRVPDGCLDPCPVGTSWSLERSCRWTISTGSTPRRRCMSKAHCWWTRLREQLWSGSGELHPVRSFLEMSRRWKRDRCCKNPGSSSMDARKQS